MSNYGREVEMMQCPFDRSHMVRNHRIQYHIVKCRKNYKGSKVACPFNASEYIDPDKMMTHLGECSFRVVRETHFFYSRTPLPKEPPPPFIHKNLPQSNENWGIDSPDEEEPEDVLSYQSNGGYKVAGAHIKQKYLNENHYPNNNFID